MEEGWSHLLHHVDAGCFCVTYLGKTWHQKALWEESKPVEAMWCFEQCSAGKHWVLPSVRMLLWHITPTPALLQNMYTLPWWLWPLSAGWYAMHSKNGSRKVWGAQSVWGVDFKVLRISIQSSVFGICWTNNSYPFRPHLGIRRSAANNLVLDTKAHHQASSWTIPAMVFW